MLSRAAVPSRPAATRASPERAKLSTAPPKDAGRVSRRRRPGITSSIASLQVETGRDRPPNRDLQTSRARRWIRSLGPGLITGAADDDPRGIATYTQAGVQFGYQLSWTLLLTFPLM